MLAVLSRMGNLLRRKTKPEGFYESFSDLIFATMAIFILLFVVILSQVNPKPKPEQAVDLVVAIDISGSMKEPLGELIETLRDLSRNFPNIIKDFRIGVVAYSENHPQGSKVFPLTTMTENSIAELDDWLANTTHRGGAVDINRAIGRAIEILEPQPNSARRKSLVIIGDAGPYEAINGETIEYFPDGKTDKRYESIAFDLVRDFAAASDENRVLTIFTGTNPRQVAYKPSSVFFCKVAASANGKGRYTASARKLVWELMESFLVEDLPAGGWRTLESCG